MSELKSILINISEEVRTKVIPENIKVGVNMFGVDGNFTSDADATATDILKDKTAYVNGEKIIGTLELPTQPETEGEYNSKLNAVGLGSFTVTGAITEIKELDLSGCTQINFNGCSRLTHLPKLNTSNITNMQSAFYNCSSLQEIPLIDTSKVTSMPHMFNGCSSLQTIPQLDFSQAQSTTSMFANCHNLRSLPELNFSNSTNCNNMFENCSNIEVIPRLITPNATSFSSTFRNCTNLKTLEGLDMGNATDIRNMFYLDHNLETLPQLDFSKVNYMSSTFHQCFALKNVGGFLNIGQGYTNASANYARYKLLLYDCTALTHESLMNIINGLYDLNSTYNVAGGGTLYTQTLYLGADNIAKLTSDELAIATNKGWTVS